MYGSGYFYIPGTETCLRIGGYVRYDASFVQEGSFDGRQNVRDHLDGSLNDAWHKNARFTLRTWTGQETELGTLRTFTETRFNFGDGTGGATSLNFAWIQLGGLRVGKDESAFDTFIGYAGSVIQHTLVPYGGFDTNVVQYYLDAGNGFSAAVSLEEGSNFESGPFAVNDTIDSYVPHVVGGVKCTQGWGAITGVVAYDSNYEEWAGKVRLDVNATNELSLFVMAGYGTDDNIARNFFKQWGGNWAVWGGGTCKFNEKTSFNIQASYDDSKDFGLAANVAYNIVPGLTVTAEVDWAHTDHAVNGNWTGIPADKKNAVGGILRFQRSF